MTTPVFDALKRHLLNLLPPTDAVLLGSAAMAVLGIRDVRDLDVLTSPGGLERVCFLPGAEGDRAAAFRFPEGVIQVSDRLYDFAAAAGLTEEEVRLGSEWWDGWRVLSLEHCVRFKRNVGREKDYVDLRAIRAWRAEHGGRE